MNRQDEQRKALTLLRNRLCGEKHVLPYIIYTEQCIDELIKAQPKDLAELGKVKGFPKDGARIKNYGRAILYALWDSSTVKDFKIKPDKDGYLQVETEMKEMTIF